MASISKQSKQTQEKHRKILAEMLRRPENKQCIDCRGGNPSWASINIGCFLCIRCSGLHRQMGVHISQVRSCTMDLWQPEQIAFMQTMGNANVKAIWEAKLPADYGKPSEEENSDMVMQWLRTKYEKKKYFSASGKPKTEPKTAEATSTPTGSIAVTKVGGKRKKSSTASPGSEPASPSSAQQNPPPTSAPPAHVKQATGWDPNSVSYLDQGGSNDGGGFSDNTGGGGGGGFGAPAGGATGFDLNAGGGFGLDNGGGNGALDNKSFSEFVSFSPAGSPRPEGADSWGNAGGATSGFNFVDTSNSGVTTTTTTLHLPKGVDNGAPSLLGGKLAPGQLSAGTGADGCASPSSVYVEGGTHSRVASGGVVFDPFDQSPPPQQNMGAPSGSSQGNMGSPSNSGIDSQFGSGGTASPTSGEVNPSGGSTAMMQMMLQQQQALVQMQMQQASVIQQGGTPSPEFAAMLEAAQTQFNSMMTMMTQQQQGGVEASPPQSPTAAPAATAQSGFDAPAQGTGGGGGFGFVNSEQQQQQQPGVSTGFGDPAPAGQSAFGFV